MNQGLGCTGDTQLARLLFQKPHVLPWFLALHSKSEPQCGTSKAMRVPALVILGLLYGSRWCPVVVTILRFLALWQQGQEMAYCSWLGTEEALIVLPVL